MIRITLIFTFLFVFSATNAQKNKITSGKAITENTTTDKSLDAKLDSIFSSFNKTTPGIAVTVIENGKVIAKKAYGMASLEFGVPFSHNTVVRINYSEGREFISIAAALMEKDGLLLFNDKVQKYFPALPAWSEPVTIQDLLNHSSGFADEWSTLALTQSSMANRLDKSQFLQFLYNQPAPSVEPGKGYMYSNSDFGLLRMIMEQASGEDLAEYMKHRVFDPLTMMDSRIHNDKEAVIVNHAFSYTIGMNNTYNLWLKDKTSPGGNYFVLTSANDLEKWAAAHSDPNSFISAAVNRLKQNARPIPVLLGTNYVFGHKLKKIGAFDAIVHMGVDDYPYIANVPEKGLTLVLFSNLLLPRWNLMQEGLSTAMSIEIPVVPKRELPQERIQIDSEEIKSFAGIYQWILPLTFQSFVPRKRYTKFVADNGALHVLYNDQDTLALLPIAKNTFSDPDFPDIFVFSQQHRDSTPQLVLYTYDGDTIKMEKLRYENPKPRRQELQKLVGKYYSKHLDYYLTLVLNETSQLVVKRPTIADKILEPYPDGDYRLMTDFGHFSSESWVRFYPDDLGNVTHFTVTNPRLMGHRFDKKSN